MSRMSRDLTNQPRMCIVSDYLRLPAFVWVAAGVHVCGSLE